MEDSVYLVPQGEMGVCSIILVNVPGLFSTNTSNKNCSINLYAHTTQLSAQIAEWYVHKDLCNKTVIPGFMWHLSAQSPLVENS